MRKIYSFLIGLTAGALDAAGWLSARNIVSRAPWLNHGRRIDGFDAFYDVMARL